MKVVLPLSTPIIQSYLHHAYQTSIIGNEQKKTLPWLLSNYIQLYFDGNEAIPIQFYMPDETGYTWNITCPWLDVQIIKKDTLNIFNMGIVDLIVSALDQGYYIVTYINEYYIPVKPSFQKNDFSHMFLINGYDLNKKVFYHQGYNNRFFGSTEIALSDFETAFYNNPKYLYHTHERLYLIKINDNFQYDFNVEFTIHQFEELFHSKRQSRFNDDPCHIFGYEVYSNLNHILKKNLDEGELINIIPFFLLAEHKRLMSMRMEYLGNMKLLDQNENYLTKFHEFEQKFIILRNKALKYNASKNKSIVDDLLNQIETLKNEETELLSKIIISLQKG